MSYYYIYIRMTQLGIHIKVRDFKKSERFYSLLGFKKIFEYGPEKEIKEDYSGAVFEVGGGLIEVANGHRAVSEEVFQEPILNSKTSLMVKVSRLSPLLKKCKNNGIKIAVAPRHYYWGTIEFVVKDPDGFVIVFICPYSKNEAKRVGACKLYAQKPLALSLKKSLI